ncbi:hypothetical protein PM082_021147 [Marasmius tenuissimus]|nr:hypothetical protein PM082_021147 [Marasmius tenuissimus]
MASDEEILRQLAETYTSVERVIVQPIATVSTMFLIYGMYIIIFGLSINVFWQRRESSASKTYTRWIIALFVLATIYNAATAWLYIEQSLVAFNAAKTRGYISLFKSLYNRLSPSEYAARFGLNTFSSGIMSCIFDYLMVHRCYIIWGYNKWILYPFAVVLVIGNTIGLVLTATLTSAYYHHNIVLYNRSNRILQVVAIISVIYSSLLTLLTAGRIWWTVRQVGQITGSRVYTKYKTILATILESGLLYSATLLVATLLPLVIDPKNLGQGSIDFSVISTQMSGIAPTLIVVRIAHGQSVESVQQMVSTLQFAEGARNNSQHQSGAIHGTVDVRQSLAGVNERGTVGRLEIDKPPSELTGPNVV